MPPSLTLRHIIPRLAFGIAVSMVAIQAHAQNLADWSGEWDSRWRGGGARLSLQQTGETVSGAYPLYSGKIEATVVGRELRGRWIEKGRSGSFVFVQSSDGQTFSGRFESGEWWTGSRTSLASAPKFLIDQHLPETTLRSFLQAMNSIGPASNDLLGYAAKLLAPAEESEAGISRLDHADLLFKVLDRLTFRIWGISRGEENVDRFTTKLTQAGTGHSLDLEFVKLDDLWYIVPPDPDLLRSTLDKLDLARQQAAPASRKNSGLHSPRDTFKTFLQGIHLERGYNADGQAMRALNMSEFSDVAKEQEVILLANYLKRTLDRVSYIIWQEIPDDPNSKEPFIHFQHPAGEVVVAPFDDEETKEVVWQFTPGTLQNIRSLYAAMEEMPLEAGLPPAPSENFYFAMRDRIRGFAPKLLQPWGIIEGWQWLGFGLVVLGSLLLGLVLGRLARLTFLRNWAERAKTQPLADFVLRWSARTLMLGVGLLMTHGLLGLPDTIAHPVTTLGWCLIVVTVTLMLLLLINVIADRYRNIPQLAGHFRALISLLAGVARVIVSIAGLVLLAHLLSIPYQGVLAGLGIGGLAVALAAQPTLQNFLSGITLYMDRPIAVGDFCSFGGTSGTVEYIGMRSTRIRTLDRTLISVPNSEFSNMQLENYAQRDQIFLKDTLQLRYETTPDQLRLVLVELRKLLLAHPKVAPEPMRVRFVAFGAHSLDIELFAYVRTQDHSEFLAIREDIYLRIMSLIEELGVQFAFPSAVHYHAQDTKSDPELAKRASETVKAWRETDSLPFPDFDWRDKAELSGKLDYPPLGSKLAEVMRDPVFGQSEE
jgi:small-conductance mechanosensitive channel